MILQSATISISPASSRACFGNLVSFPFEVIKNRIVMGDTANTPDIFSRIQIIEGMAGLYSGLIPSIMVSLIQTTGQEKLKKYFQERLVPDIEAPSDQDPPVPPIKPHNLVIYETISAACAGAAISFVVTPLQTLQLALQFGSGPEYLNAWNAFVAIWERYGLVGLYAGFLPGLISSLLVSASTWLTFSFLKQRYISSSSKSTLSAAKADRARLERQRGRRVLQLIMGIATSGIVASVVAAPFDVLRTRLVHDAITGGPLKTATMFDAVSKVVEEKGVLGLYAGIVAKCLRVGLYGVGSFVAAWGLERSFGFEQESN
eukprot:TRINITY_DN2335_c0_g1_i2.p1 TRINITY_DN2335_c0_g1~~TRINITY_DN2335_c0_g1_i2.p1  ORF type:complete len:317 (-),score=78.72 TRINITY_DN2335_c0_g1_i2:65-1015(-)